MIQNSLREAGPLFSVGNSRPKPAGPGLPVQDFVFAGEFGRVQTDWVNPRFDPGMRT
jgi:hypothetical protein